jgi:type II secretory pathway component GspD/PulD (secretin)
MIRSALLALLIVTGTASASEAVNMRFDRVPLADFVKVVFGDLLQKPYVIEDGVTDKTLSMRLEQIPRERVALVAARLLDGAGLEVVEDAGIVFVGAKRAGDKVLTYRVRHRPAAYLRDLLKQAFPAVQITTATHREPRKMASALAEGQTTTGAIGTGTTEPATSAHASSVPAQDDAGHIVLRASRSDVRAILDVLELVDTPADQVHVRAVAYDVQTDAGQGSALDLAVTVLGGRLSLSMTGGTLTGAQALTVAGSSVQAVASILDADSRFKSVARPSVRVRSGAQARFSVGQEVPTLGAVVTNQGGLSQSITYRQAGVIFEVLPHVREGGVDVQLRQTISGFRLTETSTLNSPTLSKRELETELRARPGDVIVVAGLESDEETDKEHRVFGFTVVDQKATVKRQTLLLLEVQRVAG